MANGDGATANVGLVVVKAELFLDSEELRSKGLVDFNKIHLVDGKTSSGESHLGSGNWTDSHDLWIATGRSKGNDASKRSQVVGFDSFSRSNNNSGSTVADAGSVASVDGAVFLEDWLELVELFKSSLWLWVLVVVHGDRLSLDLDIHWGHFSGEVAGFVGGEPSLLSLDGVGVGFLHCDAVLNSKVLGGDAHGKLDVLIGKAGPERVFELEILAKSSAESSASEGVGSLRHGLGTTTDTDLGHAELDLHGDDVDGFKTRPTESIDGQTGSGLVDASAESAVSSNVSGIAGALHDVADADGVDKRWVDAGLSHGSNIGVRLEVVGAEVLERTAESTEWSSLGANNENLLGQFKGHS